MTDFAAPTVDIDRCDVAVVGGGIIGLAVAREVQLRRPQASVVVLEREPVPPLIRAPTTAV